VHQAKLSVIMGLHYVELCGVNTFFFLCSFTNVVLKLAKEVDVLKDENGEDLGEGDLEELDEGAESEDEKEVPNKFDKLKIAGDALADTEEVTDTNQPNTNTTNSTNTNTNNPTSEEAGIYSCSVWCRVVLTTYLLVESDEDVAPIEKIDNRKKPDIEKTEIASEENSNSDVGDEDSNRAGDPKVSINTEQIVKNVKMKLSKNKNMQNINTRKRNIVKSKAKKEIRDTVQSF
jgi:hypothetical protein